MSAISCIKRSMEENDGKYCVEFYAPSQSDGLVDNLRGKKYYFTFLQLVVREKSKDSFK